MLIFNIKITTKRFGIIIRYFSLVLQKLSNKKKTIIKLVKRSRFHKLKKLINLPINNNILYHLKIK